MKIKFILIFYFLAISSVLWGNPQMPYAAVVNVEGAKVWYNPSTSSYLKGIVLYGGRITVCDVNQDGWYHIRTESKLSGWIDGECFVQETEWADNVLSVNQIRYDGDVGTFTVRDVQGDFSLPEIVVTAGYIKIMNIGEAEGTIRLSGLGSANVEYLNIYNSNIQKLIVDEKNDTVVSINLSGSSIDGELDFSLFSKLRSINLSVPIFSHIPDFKNNATLKTIEVSETLYQENISIFNKIAAQRNDVEIVHDMYE